jgi:hypothetical protein
MVIIRLVVKATFCSKVYIRAIFELALILWFYG